MLVSNQKYKLHSLISKEEIQQKVQNLAKQIKQDYAHIKQDEDIVFVGLLRGSVLFLADLVREIAIPNSKLDFMVISSYGKDTKSSGNIKIIKDLDDSIKGKHVIIVEDIIDTGLTLQTVVKLLLSREVKSLRICTLLNKPSRRLVEVNVDYIGFDIEDFFVVGYGIDFAGDFRTLPEIYKLEEQEK